MKFLEFKQSTMDRRSREGNLTWLLINEESFASFSSRHIRVLIFPLDPAVPHQHKLQKFDISVRNRAKIIAKTSHKLIQTLITTNL